MADSTFNSAVALCIAEAERTYNDGDCMGLDSEDRMLPAQIAYRNAMPTMTDRQSIADFIACVTHGLLLKFINDEVATKLLYGAQVALSALPRENKIKPPSKRINK